MRPRIKQTINMILFGMFGEPKSYQCVDSGKGKSRIVVFSALMDLKLEKF